MQSNKNNNTITSGVFKDQNIDSISSGDIVDLNDGYGDTQIEFILGKVDEITVSNMNSMKESLKKCIQEHVLEIKNSLSEVLYHEMSKFSNELRNDFNALKTAVMNCHMHEMDSVINDDNNNNSGNNGTGTSDGSRKNDGSSNNNKNVTYNTITKRILKPQVERIIIKAQNVSPTTNTLNVIKSSIDVIDLGINIKKVSSESNGNVIIDVEENSDKVKLTNAIHNRHGDAYKVKEINQQFPKIKIVGFEDSVVQIDE
ncbi:putative uncharacterized protein DDB_G0287457 [Microplitis mediator]|uniref:putative uncharacterized protein DDB_G0287457 n=1 Tax=Microplitis mediator TaxID=375433 RepID=UPI00255619B2|nr:putative uncharacterized protein DDB_G0287457 [Microplitis mediator]